MLNRLKIGNVELNNNIILGPMAGLTDRPFRVVCEKYNPGLVVTEMVSAKALMYNDDKTKLLLNTEEEECKIAAQIFGSDVESIGFAAKYISDLGRFDILDINMGCPAPKVVKNGDGSRLLLDLDKVREVAKAAVDSSKLPVTVKLRKGWDNDHIVAVEAAKILEEVGVSAITIHGRTRSEFYSGTADWDIIKQVKEAVNIPVIGNGDVDSPEKAKEMFEYTGCDGIMISRASLGRPWIFEEVQNYLSGKDNIEVSDEDKLNTILKHIDLEIKDKGEYTGIREMRKHICFYLKGMPNVSEIRNEINHLEDRGEIEKRLKDFFCKV